jgi:hypothetical protein
MAINTLLFGIVGLGLVAVGVTREPAPASFHAPAPVHLAMAPASDDGAEPASQAPLAPPADLEGDDSGAYMKHMTPAQLEKLYAQHDAEVARLMAGLPDDPLIGETSFTDPETGEVASIELVAF